MSKTCDLAILGGGIVGIATALELQRRLPGARIVLLEKEPQLATHQTGHNSGVIHAGVYYAPGSLKARFCREGVVATRDFCDRYKVPYEICGKLIVATDEDEMRRMEALLGRARTNGIEISPMDRMQLKDLEPHVTGLGGLLSPTTGIANFAVMARRMAELFTQRGGEIRTGVTVTGGRETARQVEINSDKGSWSAGRIVVCAGLHSDRMIRAFGHQPDYLVVPFRGEYFRIRNQPDNLVSHLIYPVPDPARPFLGVHLTRKLDGGFTVGPNAVLAAKREGYTRSALSLRDLRETFGYGGFWRLIGRNFQAASSEIAASLVKPLYLKKVQRYCPHVRLGDLVPYPAGVRAMAVSRDGQMIDDFHFVATERMLHVANAPSPAATSCIPIGSYIADRVLEVA